jgi:hypothetical protein
MTSAGRLRTALIALLVLVPLVPGHLCALCQECTPAEAAAPCHNAAPPPCHGSPPASEPSDEPDQEMTAQSCCDHLSPSPAEHERQGVVVSHGAGPAAPAAVSGPGAAPVRMATEAFRAPHPPPLHSGVSLHTLHSVFLI